MGRHVSAHRWADAEAGKLPGSQLLSMQEHAAVCPRCARTRDRVRAAREVFDDIGEAEPPRLNWEHIGARIYWETSTQRRAAVREADLAPRRRAWIYGGIGVATAAAGLVALWLSQSGSDEPPVAKAPVPAEELLPVELITEPAPSPTVPLRGVVTFRQGEVATGGETLRFDQILGPGDSLSTGEGARVTVQFGAGSGITLGPRSSVRLAAFHSRRVSLALDGEMAVQVGRREPGQVFEVVAGNHVVSVRGTAFHVSHSDGALEVACAHGKVVVSGPEAETEIEAGQLIRLMAGERLSKRVPMDLEEAARQLIEQQVASRLLPAWTDPDALFATSATLRIEAGDDREVKVDGEVIARGGFVARVMSGRHHVETENGPSSWIVLSAGEEASPAAEPPVSAEPPASKRAAARRAELDRVLGKGARVRRCLRSLEKQGLLEGSFIVLDIGINRDGSLGHLNIGDTNLPRSSATCVHSLVDAARLSKGPRASLRYRIEF